MRIQVDRQRVEWICMFLSHLPELGLELCRRNRDEQISHRLQGGIKWTFTMFGAEAGEVMAVVQMAMLGRLPFTALRDGILAHPTLAEGLNMLFTDVHEPRP